jgi:hypothetical protein
LTLTFNLFVFDIQENFSKFTEFGVAFDNCGEGFEFMTFDEYEVAVLAFV